jgi:phenylpyruvate tautomerase PptA (4-oxalocrotonate tautomerase family)
LPDDGAVIGVDCADKFGSRNRGERLRRYARRSRNRRMPFVRLTRRSGRPADENRRLLDAAHGALVEAFKTPDADRHQILAEHDAASFEITADRTDAFTLVEIIAFPGRSAGAKRALFQSLARRFDAAGVSPSDLFVVISEPPLENWSPRNGVSSADVKPSFKLDV